MSIKTVSQPLLNYIATPHPSTYRHSFKLLLYKKTNNVKHQNAKQYGLNHSRKQCI